MREMLLLPASAPIAIESVLSDGNEGGSSEIMQRSIDVIKNKRDKVILSSIMGILRGGHLF